MFFVVLCCLVVGCMQGSGEQAVGMKHFHEALKLVRPSCLRSSLGRTELSPVSWEQIGGLDEIKLKLKQVKYKQLSPQPVWWWSAWSKKIQYLSLQFVSVIFPPFCLWSVLFWVWTSRVLSGRWCTPRRLFVWVYVDPAACCSTDPQDVLRRRWSEQQPPPPTVPSCLSVVLTSTLPMWETQRRR